MNLPINNDPANSDGYCHCIWIAVLEGRAEGWARLGHRGGNGNVRATSADLAE